MSSTVTIDPGLERRLQANVRRFMLFRGTTFLYLLSPIWVVYLQEERGLSLAQVTAMEGPFWLGMVLSEVPTGLVADRFGRRTSLVLGALVNFAAILVFAFAHNYPLLFASYLLWAIGLTLLSGADSALFFDTLKALGRENDYQRLWGRAWAVQSAAILVGVGAGPTLAALTSLQLTIAFNALLFLGAAGLGLSLTEPPRREPVPGLWSNTSIAARIIWESHPVRAMMAFAAVAIASSFATGVFVQPFLRQHGVAVGAFGVLLLPGQALAIAGALAAHRITAAFGLRNAAVLCLGLTLLPLVVLATVDHVSAFAVFPVLGLVGGLFQPVVSDYINQRIPSAQRATVMSFSSLGFSLVLASTVPLAGAAGSHDLRLAFALVAAVLALPGVAFLLLLLRADRNAPFPETAAQAVAGEASTLSAPSP